MADDENTEQTSDSFETKGVRTLTAPAREEYERRVIKFTTDLRSIKNDLDAGAAHVDEVRSGFLDISQGAYSELRDRI